MLNPLEEVWTVFTQFKKEHLNLPASEEQILAVEKALGFELPNGLKDIYRFANGQRDVQDLGIFKNVSGANVYSRVWFIQIEELPMYYHLLCSQEELLTAFGDDYLPFAVEGESYLGYCFAISISKGSIHILWTDFPDPFLPIEWQLFVIKRGDNMEHFIQNQNTLLF